MRPSVTCKYPDRKAIYDIVKGLVFTPILLIAVTVTAQETTPEPYVLEAEWTLLSSQTGIKRYAGEKPNQPHLPLIIGDTAYWVAGNGYSDGSSATNQVLSMDLNTGDMTEQTSMGRNFLKGNATAEYQGRLLSVGGSGNFVNYNLNYTLAYDTVTGEWRQQTAAPLARENAMAEQVNGQLYVFGGWGFDTFNRAQVRLDDDGFFYTDVAETATWRQEVQAYDIAADTWSVVSEAPTDQPFRASTLVEGKVYLSAEADWVTANETLYVYDTQTNGWNTLSVPVPLVSKKLVSVGHLVLVYGLTDWSMVSNSLWQSYIYDTREQQWYQGIALPNADNITSVFALASEGDDLYYFEYAESPWDNADKQVYRLDFNIGASADQGYQPFEQQTMTELTNDNGDILYINESGSVANLVVADWQDYDDVWNGRGDEAQKAALKRITQSVYSQLQDQFTFMFLVFNEAEHAPYPAPHGYHTPIQNAIEGIGQGVFDFAQAYGSRDKLESVVVLGAADDIIHGPSLHELGHRWGNYLTGSLDAMRQLGWVACMAPELMPFHWGLLNNGGQLGGWHEEDLSMGDDDTTTYMLNDGVEGFAGFRGIGPGNNFIGYSNLELYLMGLLPHTAVGELREPSSPPIELDINPLFIIDSFNDISMDTVVQENGIRTPAVDEAVTRFDTVFVVLSKEPLSQAEWHNYEGQVQNFTKTEHDDYQRLNNFWEATDGKASLLVPNLHEALQTASASVYTRGDFDGDGKADIAVRRPSTYMQYILNSENNDIQRHYFGKDGFDIPVVGDFDGDGVSDVAVRRPTNSMWYIQNSSDDNLQRIEFGMQQEDIPVPADYDGDGITDVAVRRPSTQMWYILNSSDGEIQRIHFGKQEADIPVPADYDGDGKADVAVRRPSTQMWYILNSSDGEIQRIHFGKQEADIPVPADYDGDGKADIAVRRPATQMWYILNSSDDVIQRHHFGKQEADIPVPADYDGDGKADIAVRRAANYMFYIMRSSDDEIQRAEFGKDESDIPLLATPVMLMEMASQ
ncbi:FG-GAP-like repeat-containing protein [Planctobacterium marinum]|uniref:FG-GAP-like repeat-containing protein n=1 Tax=Planctobacterium marinum TaxID=1631968 RepID=UPI001E63BDC2|nr:FG-GAP-like repeat-containing protein [Planctobacterium marinum]MCC2605448.1 FG-GAP-like repeat-containing protein [Planctobacterium marinum]